MASLFSENRRIRKEFSKIATPVEIPNLIDLQRKSYEKFLQADIPPQKRETMGLQSVFKSVFPIEDFNKTASLEFESYSLERPKYDVGECRQRGMTFAAPLKITVRLVVFEVDEEAGTRNIRDIKEQEVYMGEIPLMTEAGSFIINGTERVIVSQLHRSPGVIFDHDQGKSHSSGKILYSARMIPHRGSWLDFEFDHKDILYARIDRKRKLPATIVLKAMGLSTQEILSYFYRTEVLSFDKDGKYYKAVDLELLSGQRADEDILEPESGDVIVKKNRKFTKAVIKKIQDAGIKRFEVALENVLGRVAAEDLVDEATGEVLIECNHELSEAKLEELKGKGVKAVKVIYTDNLTYGAFVRETLQIDKVSSPDEALIEIYKRMRPGDPPTIEASKQLFENMFFNPDRYDLSRVGRLKLNYKFPNNGVAQGTTTLTKEDILSTLFYLCELNNGRGTIDDIDHLGNRRVRPVGELIENQYRIGLVRMERAIKERMSIQEIETLMPHDLINQKPVSAVVKEFFGSSQLSQFMDQTNPLSEVTHKRRLSALGPGGLTRERAGFEVRDVHNTHYGRICPIETPEGPNIGLIASLSTYARVNEFGFIETPYRIIGERKVTDEIRFFTATEEENKIIAQVSPEALRTGKLGADHVSARRKGEFALVNPDDVEMMDVSPNQLVSIAASLIPFLEHDDANRALMGSNMQRQAVPLIRTSAPLVGTGIERVVARDSGQVILARHDGEVIMVDGSKIVVRRSGRNDSVGSDVDIYNLTKYQRSNQGTCVNQRPVVKSGDKVKAGDVLGDGPSTDAGELALGQNVLIAFMPWNGYNFEDSILISERIIKDDTFTSIHIEEFECVARDTKLGKEEITRDIPNVGEEALKDLDQSGIIRIGAEVKPGDILVGKVTPKGETQLSPEEKLLRAIFGEKAGDVRDSSLRVPSGVQGVIIDAQVFAREGTEPDERTKQILEEQIATIRRDEKIEVEAIRLSAFNKIAKTLEGSLTSGKLLSEDGSEELLKKGQTLERAVLEVIPFDLLAFIPVKEDLEQEVTQVMKTAKEKVEAVRFVFKEKTEKLKKGDELPPGVIKMVKVQVAIKRKLQVGDKMAGRHGNKGVVSRIVPIEDMPFMANGKPVDMVLNPLGVPSRMNIGQLLEVTLGWAARGIGEKITDALEQFKPENLRKVLKATYSTPEVDKYVDQASEAELKKMASHLRNGVHFATPVFDGASEADIEKALGVAELPARGQTTLYDGVTGEPFAEDVTVGVMYMLKLHHLVEEKIHARSIGPYSLVTQQPLGGKAQFGGQRLGEMEVWALEAYGAAYALQEFLTVKSDDVTGRNRIYEAIVKGEQLLEPGLPESFNVLVKELQSLALNVELIEDDGKGAEGLTGLN
jgi:DNA-directed RNA polymerase subunit beta